jgi:hypothetical protein
MRESDIYRRIILQNKIEGVAEVVAGNKAIVASNEQVAKSAKQLADETEKAAKREASLRKQAETIIRGSSATNRAEAEFVNKSKILFQSVAQGTTAFNDAAKAASVYRDKLDEAIAAENRLNAARSSANQRRFDQLNPAQHDVLKQRGQDSADDIEKLRAKMVPLYAIGQQYRKTVEEINLANRAGVITEKERAAAMEMAKTAVQNQVHALKSGATAGRLMAGEMANLSFQLNDVVTGLALGQSPFMIMAQQGGQVYQILANSQGGVKGAIKEIGSTLAGLVTPARVAMAGIAGLGAGALLVANNWSEAGREIDRALLGIGRRSGETQSSINKFANANSSLVGLSVSEARNIGIEFAKTGMLAASGLKGLGDAVKGYAILTGTDATAATKELASAFSGDLVQAALKVDSVYGVMNASTMESIRSLEAQGKRAEAVQLILDRMADTNKKAAESQGFWSRIGTGISNFASNVFNGNPPATGDDIQAQMEDVRRRRDEAVAGRSRRLTPATLARGADGGEVAALTAQLEKLQEQYDKQNSDNAVSQMQKLSMEAFKIGEAVLPQVGNIAQLEAAITKLEKARELLEPSPDAEGPSFVPPNMDGMLDVLRQKRAMEQESLQAIQRQAQFVNQLQAAWGGVSAQTAITLQNLRGQLMVAQQVTGAGQIRAQQQATVNQLLAEGKALEEASAIAREQRAVAEAGATANVERQTQALLDQNEMIKARQNGTEATTAAAIAYRNAIDSGANSTAAAALHAATLKNNMLEAASAASQLNAMQSQLGAGVHIVGATTNMVSTEDENTGSFFREKSKMGQGGSNRSDFDVPNPFLPSAIRQGAWTDIELASAGGTGLKVMIEAARAAFRKEHDDAMRKALGEMYGDFKYASSSADISGAMNVRAGELRGSDNRDEKLQGMQMQLDALSMQYPTLTRLAEMEALRREMEKLRNSVDENTAALNKVTLNPLYNGRDALRVGYMGAANGLDMMVKGGMPGVDSVPIHIMAQQGERVRVDPVGSVSNDNSKSTTVIMNNYFGGSGSSNRRSERSMVQTFAQQLAAVS